MINVIWQTRRNGISILGDETNGQYEYITRVILKNVKYINYFDNNEYKTFLDNSIIVHSSPLPEISNDLKTYLQKYKSLNLKYILLHLSNENLNHNCDYYSEAEHVFRFYYDEEIKNPNVTTLPLGFVSGYMNTNGDINLSNDRYIPISFIGQVKSDRGMMVNSIKNINNSFLYLTSKWNCPNGLPIDEVVNIYKRTKFVPCPKGWVNPDSLRLFEALEWGCIPIIKKYDGVDYFEHIFGKHPIPTVDDWTEVSDLIDNLNNENLDELILSINKWYIEFMKSISINVGNIIKEKLGV